VVAVEGRQFRQAAADLFAKGNRWCATRKLDSRTRSNAGSSARHSFRAIRPIRFH
jgi:hypothetical protein